MLFNLVKTKTSPLKLSLKQNLKMFKEKSLVFFQVYVHTNGGKSIKYFIYFSFILICLLCTVGENIIATIKIQNNFCYPLKNGIFSILQ